jgi:hypothetical protein
MNGDVKSVYGWRGKEVRNIDGRAGVISNEHQFGPWLDLIIECRDGTQAKVTLNAHGKDMGEAGWQWMCENFCRGPSWLPLSDKGAPLDLGAPL